jgi:flagellar basal body P-ring protein FlgI
VPRAVQGLVRLALCVAAAGLLAGPGCGSKNKRPPQATRATPLVVRDVPEPLRGTVGSVARIDGVMPVLASGLGYVVGLNGTGGLPLPQDVAAHMEREMRLNGIGPATDTTETAIDGRAPSAMLRDPNTAVVIVQAAVHAGAPEGSSMDIYVRALNATSLEGGQLWTTRLRIGPPSSFRSIQARVVAEARGPIFINPFAEPGAEEDGVTRTAGRILDGGVVTESVQLILQLDNPSHSLAQAVTDAINSRFPAGRGDRGPPASGQNAEIIKLRIPYEYREREAEFLELVQYLPIDQTYPQATARRLTEALAREPALGEEISWALQAVGPQAKPFLREMYGYHEVVPRLAALRAGAALNDARAVPYLIEMATAGLERHRTAAIGMLSRIEAGPEIERALQSLLASDELEVRVAAYEALASRAEEAQLKRLVAEERRERNPVARRSYDMLYALSRAYLPAGSLQGVSRTLVEDKFFLDRVPVGKPMIYITQQRVPRVVLFGEEIGLRAPLTATMWSDRLMFISDAPDEPVRVYYRTLPQVVNGEPVDGTSRVMTAEIEPDILELIAFMAHGPSPEDPRPGLGLSYSETVGALYGLYKDQGLAAAFSTERDRLVAELEGLTARGGEIEMRPERPGEQSEVVVFDDPARLLGGDELRSDNSASDLLVPLRAPTPPPAEGRGGEARPEGG